MNGLTHVGRGNDAEGTAGEEGGRRGHHVRGEEKEREREREREVKMKRERFPCSLKQKLKNTL